MYADVLERKACLITMISFCSIEFFFFPFSSQIFGKKEVFGLSLHVLYVVYTKTGQSSSMLPIYARSHKAFFSLLLKRRGRQRLSTETGSHIKGIRRKISLLCVWSIAQFHCQIWVWKGITSHISLTEIFYAIFLNSRLDCLLRSPDIH